MKLCNRQRARFPKVAVHVVYVKNTLGFEERVVRVVTREEDARALEGKLGLTSPQRAEWETVEVQDAVNSPLGVGDTIYLLSEGEPSDDKAEEYSPNAIAAFVRRESVDEFLQDPKNHEYSVDLRMRTLSISVPLT